MKAKVDLLSGQRPFVNIIHNEETLNFTISVFGRDNFPMENDVFNYINQYWSELPINEQDQIFNIYKQVQWGFDNIYSRNELADYLTEQVRNLIDLHQLDKLQQFISFRTDIRIPDTFNVEYSHSIDNHTSREKTYTRNDYVSLITLCLCLRTMIPIWGEFIALIREQTGAIFKEFYSFQLLNKSHIIHSPAMEKLGVYLENIVGKNKKDYNNTLKGISSEDFSYWLLSLICIKRLCIGDLRGSEPMSNMVTLVYKYIIQKINNTDNKFENAVQLKFSEDISSAGNENKISSIERFRIKTNISPGEIVEIEHSMLDMRRVAQRLSYNLNPQILERSLETSNQLTNQKLLEPQINLFRWVFKPVLSPRDAMFLPKHQVIEALGAVEAVLWARGHKYLAILATAYPVITKHDNEILISPVDSRIRIPKEMLDQLDELYPYSRPVSTKKNGNKTPNQAVIAIDLMVDQLTAYAWRSTADESLLKEVFGNVSRRLQIKPDIKIELTKLVIELGARTYV